MSSSVGSGRKHRAVCIDLDGTLVDSGPLHAEAERLALASLGIRELAADHPITFGAGIMPGMQMLADHYEIDSAERVFKAYLPTWEAAFESGLKPMPGSSELLERLFSRNTPVALVTSGENEYVDRVLRRFGWQRYFVHTVTLESVHEIKPSPEPYLHAARLLKAWPDECIGVEDSASGLRSVIAAGLFSIGVGSQLATLDGLNADLQVDSLTDLDETLLAQLNI